MRKITGLKGLNPKGSGIARYGLECFFCIPLLYEQDNRLGDYRNAFFCFTLQHLPPSAPEHRTFI